MNQPKIDSKKKLKPAKLYDQSGVLAIMDKRIVLITTIKSGKWGIPKGIIGKGMTPIESAEQEAYEEAGIVGQVIHDQIGEYKHKKWDGICTVKVYPLLVENLLDNWEEKNLRKRIIVEPKQAISLVRKRVLREIIRNYFKF